MVKAYTNDATLGFLYGLVKACGAICVIVIQLTIGFISDHSESRLGRRRPYIITGIVSGCAAIALYMLAPSYWWLFAGYLLLELTINVASIPFQSLLPDLVPERQVAHAGGTMGLLHMAGYLTALVVLAVAAFVFGGDALLSYRVVILPVAIGLMLIFALITILGVDEHGWRQAAATRITGAVRTLKVLPGTVARFAATAPSILGCIIKDYRKVEIRSQRNLVFLWFSRFIVFLGYAAFISFGKLYFDSNFRWEAWLSQFGISDVELVSFQTMVVSAIMASFVIGGLGGSLVSGMLAQRYSKKAVIACGMLLSGSTSILLVLTREVWSAICIGLFIGLGWGAFIASDWALAVALMPKLKAGSYMGLWDISTLLPQVLAPVISGLLYQIVYSFHAGGGWMRFSLITENLPSKDPVSAALAHKWIIASLPIYFAIGLLILRNVKEPPVRQLEAD